MKNTTLLPALAGLILSLSACADAGPPAAPASAQPFTRSEIARFNEPWAIAFLPDGRMLVTEKPGTLQLVTAAGSKSVVAGTPEVAYGDQGGLGDIRLAPDYAQSRRVYLSFAEPGEGDTRGAALGAGTLDLDAEPPRIDDFKVIWRQSEKLKGGGHFGHRIVFGPDGKLWLSSSDRQAMDPAQDLDSNIGKILRLELDGSPVADNPFADRGGASREIWSLGHRNVLGMAFDAAGQLWEVEMGPRGGDELNRVERGANYGWPLVSEGIHYSGKSIPDHATRPEFKAPAIAWTPVISPGSMIIYSGDVFPEWRGQALISGLSSESLVRVDLDADPPREVARYAMGRRMRAVAEDPKGQLWMLQDGKDGALLKLVPKKNPSPDGED